MDEEEDRRKRKKRDDDDEDQVPFRTRPRRGYDPFFGSNIDEEFERMRRYMDRMMHDAMHGSLGGGGADKPFIYGFTMRTGPDGKPHIQEFGNTDRVRRLNGNRPGPKASSCPRVEGERDEAREVRGREPLTDVIDCGDTIAVTIELPGVEKEEIQLEVHEDKLTIKVDTESRRYYKEVELPAEVKDDTAQASYKNGVLDVTLRKSSPTKRKGKRVEIK